MGTTADAATSPAFEPFSYPVVAAPPAPAWEAYGVENSEPAGTRAAQAAVDLDESRSEAARADELRRCLEQARERGFQEGRALERESVAALIKARDGSRIEPAGRLLEDFNLERARYFEAVEHEVVKLALALAARILRREAQMDPLLLSGAVRVALGQLSASTQVRLRVPAADLELWADAIAHLPNLAPKPAVVPGEAMQLGDCVLETELGSVDLGLGAQLQEIERGFFDRAGRNPSPVREDMSE